MRRSGATILVVTPDYPPSHGGIQRLMARLVEHGRRCRAVVVTRAPAAELVSRDSAVRRVKRPPGGQAGAIAALNACALLAAVRLRPDVVISGHVAVSPVARAVKRLTGTPYVQYLYGLELASRPRLASAAVRNADAVVAISRYTEQLALAHGADRRTLHRISPGVDLARPAPVRRFQAPTVVTVSRLDERYKGHDVLIRALPLVRARVPDARLLVVGDGALRPVYEGLAKALGLDGAVQFTGAVEDEERDRLVAGSHVFAMPSRLAANAGGEGFGIAYLEAGALGVPVVAGSVGGALDAVVDGETGVLVDPWNHVELADAIAALLLDPARAEALGRAGCERAREFAWPKVAAQVEDVVLELANARA